jgi:hypothetical protein
MLKAGFQSQVQAGFVGAQLVARSASIPAPKVIARRSRALAYKGFTSEG